MIWETAVFQIIILFDAIMLGACLSVYLVTTINNNEQH